jgi:hypothetical protein
LLWRINKIKVTPIVKLATVKEIKGCSKQILIHEYNILFTDPDEELKRSISDQCQVDQVPANHFKGKILLGPR